MKVTIALLVVYGLTLVIEVPIGLYMLYDLAGPRRLERALVLV